MREGPHLGVHQPAVVQRDVEQIEDDALRRVLEDPHARELHVHIQTRLQLVQHRHGVAHVLEHTEDSPDVLGESRDTRRPGRVVNWKLRRSRGAVSPSWTGGLICYIILGLSAHVSTAAAIRD